MGKLDSALLCSWIHLPWIHNFLCKVAVICTYLSSKLNKNILKRKHLGTAAFCFRFKLFLLLLTFNIYTYSGTGKHKYMFSLNIIWISIVEIQRIKLWKILLSHCERNIWRLCSISLISSWKPTETASVNLNEVYIPTYLLLCISKWVECYVNCVIIRTS